MELRFSTLAVTCDTFKAADHLLETVRVRALVQPVSRAKVTVGVGTDAEEITGEIGAGVLVFVGVNHADTDVEAVKLAAKIRNLRNRGSTGLPPNWSQWGLRS